MEKQVMMEAYEAPVVEVIEVEVEKGFAASDEYEDPTGDVPGFGRG